MGFSMPIFEYVCRECQTSFEAIVSRDREAACPTCRGRDLEKQLSVFAVSSGRARETGPEAAACGTCGDPRGAGSCRLN